MNRFDSYRRWTILFTGLVIAAFSGLYFFHASAQTEKIETPTELNLVNGRLAFSRRRTQMGQEEFIETSNPDGSNRVTIGFLSLSNLSIDPAWSPDGTRIAFAVATPSVDIWVANADGSGPTNVTNTGFSFGETNPSWSVTGKIAYERRVDVFSAPQIWTMNADGSGPAQFSGITQPSPTGPSWSPDGTKLAFSSGGDIWVINADGTNQQRLTINATNDLDPAWSPDGTKIVFSRGGLATINADGTNETPLTTANDTLPAWSPDGTKIAFRRSGPSPLPSGIYSMDANGGNQVSIIPDSTAPFPAASVSYWSPAWQPVAQAPNTYIISGRVTYEGQGLGGVTVDLSGTTKASVTTDSAGNYSFSSLAAGGNYTVSPSRLRHYFTPANRSFNNLSSDQTGHNFQVLGVCQSGRCVRNGKIAFGRSGDIFTMNQDGTGVTNVTNHPANDFGPDWSPDGVKIIFSSDRDGNAEIYRKNSEDDMNPTRLTDNPASDILPEYSPDGSTIVFTSNREGTSDIYKMNADGSNQVRLTTDVGHESAASFSPDGQKIIFVRQPPGGMPWNMLTMNVDGTNQQPIFGPVNFVTSPSYSPDGTKIILVFGGDISLQDIYTMNADGTNITDAGFGRSQPAYSPDGSKVVHNCCFSVGGPNPNGLFVTTIAGLSTQRLTSIDDNGPDWQPRPAPRPAVFDFDGDGRSDISFFRGAGGFWHMLRSTDGPAAPQWGLATDVLTPGDYDGDLKTDLAIWRESDNNFYVLNSFDGTVRIENFGLAGDVPTGGDFDGDGKAEVAVYRAGAQSTFYYRASMGNPVGNITSIPWGVTGDKPVVGDYDGDGRSDAAVYRPSTGIWYVRKSTDAQMLAVHFGIADDDLVPADYDGDAKTDFAVFRAGVWYLLRSAQGFTAFQFGLAKDIPAPADYDGDGRADVTIFRDGVWWTISSQTGTVIAVSFGAAGDKPIPAAYVR